MKYVSLLKNSVKFTVILVKVVCKSIVTCFSDKKMNKFIYIEILSNEFLLRH